MTINPPQLQGTLPQEEEHLEGDPPHAQAQAQAQGELGKRAARLCQKSFQTSVPSSDAQEMIKQMVEATNKVNIEHVRIVLDHKTVKLLGLGISRLDAESLNMSVRDAQYVPLAGDESLGNRDEKFSNFVAF